MITHSDWWLRCRAVLENGTETRQCHKWDLMILFVLCITMQPIFVSHMTYTKSRMLLPKLCFCLAFACLTILSKLTVCGQKTRACICNCSQMVLLLTLQTLHPSCLGLELDCKPPKVTWFFCGLASTEDKAHVSIRALYWARLLPKSTLKSKKDLSSTYVIKQALNYPMIAMSDVVEYYLQSLWVRDLLQYNLPKMASGNLSADIIV